MTSIMQYMENNNLLWSAGVRDTKKELREQRLKWLASKGTTTAREAARAWGINHTSASHYLHDLSLEGFVERTPHISRGRHGTLPILYRVNQNGGT